MRLFGAFFFLSGFLSLAYEIVWLRLAMADFGVNTALVSAFVSAFMAGLGLGCWAAGRWCAERDDSAAALLEAYAAAELLIAAGGLLTPRLMALQRSLLNDPASALAWSSGGYFAASGLCVAVSVLPWAAAMGATLPLGMAAIRRLFPDRSERSFSFLYAANVLGAGAGSLTAAFLEIELLGFSGTLKAAACLNVLLAAGILSASGARGRAARERAEPAVPPAPRGALGLLFLSGAASMGMEIVWSRQYPGYLGNHVYAFASILWVYLLSTFAGARAYRAKGEGLAAAPILLGAAVLVLAGLSPLLLVGSWLPMPGNEFGRPGAALLAFKGVFAVGALCATSRGDLLPGLGALGLLPLIFVDPTLPLPARFSSGALRLVLGVAPFSAAAGFFTSRLMDSFGGGRPEAAAKAYAVNMAGCILGPLAAGFLLLPRLGETWSLLVLSAPFLLMGARTAVGKTALAAGVLLALSARGVSDFAPQSLTRRDATATVCVWGRGLGRMIAINGVPGVTRLLAETKMMAHLPLAFLQRPPKKALVICFGMGTTFRSALSWGIETTAVELVPSVPEFFGFFHEDAAALRALSRARIVIDDGRRFLDRSRETFDVITVDPPPPMQAPGSSLLYSAQFYEAAKRRLAPDGILQSWCVPNEPLVTEAVGRALTRSFKNVRAFLALGDRGVHYLASDAPLPPLTPEALAARLPSQAARDLVEWDREPSVPRRFAKVLGREMALPSGEGSALSDDRPVNEYFLARWLFRRILGASSFGYLDSAPRNW